MFLTMITGMVLVQDLHVAILCSNAASIVTILTV